MKDARAVAVVDLGFGDSGKGVVVDALARRLGSCLVVRFNGGAQAGHNVVTPDGRHHTFSQFGAGTFVPGTRTFLSRKMIVHPTALLIEADILAAKGVSDCWERLTISRSALVIAPFQQALGRLRELARGGARHGSCGVGVGEAVGDSLSSGASVLRVGDLEDRVRARRILARMQERKRVQAADLALAAGPAGESELRLIDDAGTVDAWLDQIEGFRRKARLVDDSYLAEREREGDALVFEGAQGVLLDERHGYSPYTTWSDCTFGGAEELLGGLRPLERLGVLRTYLTRHGAGPFPTEDASLDARLSETHNSTGPWQGPVRRGWPDWTLMRYAIAACGGIHALALTHLDALDGARVWRAAVDGGSKAHALTRTAVRYQELPLPGGVASGESYLRLVSDAACVATAFSSRGPSSASVEWRSARSLSKS